MEKKLTVDGIAIISDADENTAPWFAERYRKYVEVNKSEPTVYLYRCGSYGQRQGAGVDLRDSMAGNIAGTNLAMTEFALGSSIDYYSIPNLCATMNTKRYSLIEQILDTPLIKLTDVFDGSLYQKSKKGKKKQYA